MSEARRYAPQKSAMTYSKPRQNLEAEQIMSVVMFRGAPYDILRQEAPQRPSPPVPPHQ